MEINYDSRTRKTSTNFRPRILNIFAPLNKLILSWIRILKIEDRNVSLLAWAPPVGREKYHDES